MKTKLIKYRENKIETEASPHAKQLKAAMLRDGVRELDLWWDCYSQGWPKLINYLLNMFLGLEKPAIRGQFFNKRNGLTRRGFQFKQNLEIVLADLFVLQDRNPEMFVFFSQDMKTYKKSRYVREEVSPRILLRIFKFLIDNNFVEYHTGYYDRENGGYKSRMRATSLLIELFHQYKIKRKDCVRGLGEPVILQKRIKIKRGGKKKQLVEYLDTAETIGWRTIMSEYYRQLDDYFFDMITETNEEEDIKRQIDFNNKYPKKIFSRGDNSFKYGGRIYGGFWQNYNKNIRKLFTANGRQFTEYDYGALHITMLYLARGITPPTEYAYDIPGYPKCSEDPEWKKFIKLIINPIINADSMEKVAQNIRLKHRMPIKQKKDGGYYKTKLSKEERDRKKLKIPSVLPDFEDETLFKVMNDIRDYHSPIGDDFFSDRGVALQRLDSDIAIKIIMYFMYKTLVLPVHDSFMVFKEYGDELEWVMSDAFKRIMRTDYKIRITKKY